jgi:hypothetical protein
MPNASEKKASTIMKIVTFSIGEKRIFLKMFTHPKVFAGCV